MIFIYKYIIMCIIIIPYMWRSQLIINKLWSECLKLTFQTNVLHTVLGALIFPFLKKFSLLFKFQQNFFTIFLFYFIFFHLFI